MTVTVADQARHQIIARCAFNRVFTRRKHLRYGHHVGLVETATELFEQIVQPAIAVRLVHGDHPPVTGLPCRFQYCGDLNRMVAIIINNGDTIDLVNYGKATVDAFECGQRITNLIKIHAQMTCHRYRRKGV